MDMVRALAVVTLAALAAAPAALAEPAIGSRSAGDGWIVDVSVKLSEAGPIAVSTGPLTPAPVGPARAWLRHDLVVENNGTRPVTFVRLRTATALLGPSRGPVLLAADEGCGWGNGGTKRVEVVCLAYLDVLTVEPHASVTLTVTLFRGLPGMKALPPGTYVFPKPLLFRAGRSLPPEEGGRRITIRLVYGVDVG